MELEKTREYSNGEITIIWKPSLCVHAGICMRSLPAVYRPRERPWVKIENATTEQLKEQVAKCPTQALSYRENEETYHNFLDHKIK